MRNLLLSLFLLPSCALFKKNSLSNSLKENIHKVCLSSQGRGRVIVNNQKYIFSFESALRDDEDNWIMALNFPIYGEEYVEIDWSDNEIKHTVSFENQLLKDQKGLSAEKLDRFLKTWTQLLHEIIMLKKNKPMTTQYNWRFNNKELAVTGGDSDGDSDVTIWFKNLVDSKYFGRYDIEVDASTKLSSAQSRGMNQFRIEVIVRKCLE